MSWTSLCNIQVCPCKLAHDKPLLNASYYRCRHRHRYKHGDGSGPVSLSSGWLEEAPDHLSLEGKPRSPQAHCCCSSTGQSLEISNLSKCQPSPWFLPSVWPSTLTLTSNCSWLHVSWQPWIFFPSRLNFWLSVGKFLSPPAHLHLTEPGRAGRLKGTVTVREGQGPPGTFSGPYSLIIYIMS